MTKIDSILNLSSNYAQYKFFVENFVKIEYVLKICSIFFLSKNELKLKIGLILDIVKSLLNFCHKIEFEYTRPRLKFFFKFIFGRSKSSLGQIFDRKLNS